MVYFFIIYGVDVIFVGYNEFFGMISCVCFLVLRVFSFLGEILKRGGNLNDEYEYIGKFVLQLVFEVKVDRNIVKVIIRVGVNLNWKDKFGKFFVFGLIFLGMFCF